MSVITPTEILYYFDGPMIFIWGEFLFYFVEKSDNDEDHWEYLMGLVTSEEIENLKNRTFDLHSTLKNKSFDSATINMDTMELISISGNAVDSEFVDVVLPKPGTFLDRL